MKKSCLLLFLTGVILTSAAQSPHLITTVQQHARWMEQLSQQTTAGQKKMIADRLLADTLIVVFRPNSHVGPVSEAQRAQLVKERQQQLRNKSTGIRMPLLLINGHPLQQEYYEPLPAAGAAAIAALIRETGFKRITQLNGAKATAVYGIRGANGVLLMELKKKTDLQKFKALSAESANNP
ncbi:hypothetical protein [Niabella beijingensis]|uniref:hypothetical protein n=1 Tax=Niabella beijingensis TaxID=2872700 RepID=UPI001CBC3B96|nr:hypothetical protein [Niabella beijingensis]MBZ4187955.1 hypothetical protein [Niabella beijingensis]